MAAYGDFEYGIVLGHKHDLETGEILKGNPDLNFSKARNKYNKFINDVASVGAREFKIEQFQKIDKKTTIDMAVSIILYIFGDEAITQVKEFLKVLMPANEKGMSVLDGIVLTVTDPTKNETMQLTQVPDLERSGCIVTIVHEFAHFYLKEKQVDETKKRYYYEIISILAEKIAHFMTEYHLKEYGFSQKIEESRLEAIAYHYKEQLPMVEARIKEHEQIKKLAESGNPMMRMVLAKMESEIPLLDTPANIAILRDYYQAQADSFGIGYLYAENLFQKFLEDNTVFSQRLKALCGREIGLQDLLNYYGLDLRDYQTYNNVTDKLEQVKKCKTMI